MILVLFHFIWQNFHMDCTDIWFPSECMLGPKDKLVSAHYTYSAY